jgi:hypothetical protein
MAHWYLDDSHQHRKSSLSVAADAADLARFPAGECASRQIEDDGALFIANAPTVK